MAISANCVWEVRTTGSQNNGGGFVTGASGSDFSQQASAGYALTGVTSAGAGNVILSASAAADMVGNVIKVVSGTNFTVGWFEITSVTVGVDITCSTNSAGAAISTGVGATGVMNVGGAFLIGGTLDDDFFEAGTAGNVYHIKTGTYNVGESISIARSGGTQLPTIVYGYNSTRGDAPIGSTRPLLACGSSTITWGANWDIYYIQMSSSGATCCTGGGNEKFIHCKATNTSTTVDRNAFLPGVDGYMFACEGISYRGRGIAFASDGGTAKACYFHSSNLGAFVALTSQTSAIIGCIFSSNYTAAVRFGAVTSAQVLDGCTLYGSENTTGTGITLDSGATDVRVTNNIIYGFTTGVSHTNSQTVSFDDYNDYYNNDTDVTNWTKGSHDSTANPTFSSVGQVAGTAGAFTAGNDRIVDTSKNFSSLGVVANQDHIYIVSGTGVTAGIYAITSITTTTNPNDTLVLTPAPGTNTTTNKVYQITIGHNFAIGTNLKALGFPGTFPAGFSAGYTDMGAVQRQELGGLPPRIMQITGAHRSEY